MQRLTQWITARPPADLVRLSGQPHRRLPIVTDRHGFIMPRKRCRIIQPVHGLDTVGEITEAAGMTVDRMGRSGSPIP